VNPVVKINNYRGIGAGDVDVVSKDLYTGTTPIQSVLLSSNATLEGNANITYWVSFTGTDWTQATPGTLLKASTPGTTVKWKAILSGSNPILHWVNLKMSTTDTVSQPNIPAGDYVYVEANCSDSQYQIGAIQDLDSGIRSARIQGKYTVQGDRNNYVDPGPVGVYNEETDVKLLRKYLNVK
jgi:hypothetical protein